MEMGRQSVPQTAHPNQQALRLQFPTEPRFLRLNHEALSFPVEHDADFHLCLHHFARGAACRVPARKAILPESPRSEEHTSELQSRLHLVCRLLLEKKKKRTVTVVLIDLSECMSV